MHPSANAISRVKRSCRLPFRARDAGGGFLKLTYMLILEIEAIKKVGKGYAFIHLFKC